MKPKLCAFRVLPAVAATLLFQASCTMARAQDIIYDGNKVIAAQGLEAGFGATYSVVGGAAGPNEFGGYFFSFENPTGPGGGNAGQTGDSILGDNYGGVYFAEGSEVDNETAPAVYITGPDDNIYEVTSYSGPYFLGPPGANDTVSFEPLATPETSPPIPIADLTEFGVGNGELEAGYDYPGSVVTGAPAATYTIALSGTIAELIGTSGYNAADTQYNYENPVVQLSGAFTATHDAILSGLDSTNPLVIQGNGSITTAYALLAGAINMMGGTLNATQLVVGNDIPGYFGTNFYTGTSGVEDDNFAPSTLVTVTGASSVLNATNYLVVGVATGTTTLQLMNGAQANTGDIYVADETGSTGNLVVNASTLISTGFMDVGEGANTTAQVTISNGGKISDTIGAIGFGNNADASVTVTGSGSVWNNTGYVAVGYSGTNVVDHLTVTNGGAVNSLGFLVVGGQAQEGTSGYGTLGIMGGGKVVSGINAPAQSLAAAVGFGSDSFGSVLIDGSGSSWDIKQRLDLGYSAGSTGNVTVENGATLQVEGDIVRLGNVQGSTGSLTFDGTGGSPTFNFTTANSELLIGDEGAGNFTVQAGAQITESAEVDIGYQSTGVGNATVQGASSSWTINNSLTVGYSGTGTLSIFNGDKVTVQQGENVVLGDQAGSMGVLVLDGAGSALNVSQASSGSAGGDALEIGNHGIGKLTVQNGASITFNNDTFLGSQTDGTGQITVDGTSSIATFNDGLDVGRDATGSGGNSGGSLLVSGGAQVTVAGTGLTVGDDQGSTGVISVAGAGSTLNVSASLTTIGDEGTGTLNVVNGGQFNALDNIVAVGNQQGTTSATTSVVNITGTGAGGSGSGQTQFTTGNLFVGLDGYGVLNASQGAQLTTNGSVLIASAITAYQSLGTVTVDTKSVWNVTQNVSVGGAGTGNLTLMGGSTLDAVGLTIGDGNTLGKVTVTGSASTLTTNNIGVGGITGSNGTLLIQNGGQVSTQVFYFGDTVGTATLTVDGTSSGGTPSTLTASTLTLGGTDAITVSNGGLLTVKGATFQDNHFAMSAGSATITVMGAGSKLDASTAATTLVNTSNINIMDGGELDTGATGIGNAGIQLDSTGNTSTWNVTGPLALDSDLVTVMNNSTISVSQGASLSNGAMTLNGSGSSFKAKLLQVTQGGILTANNQSQVILGTSLSVSPLALIFVTGGGSVQVANPANAASGSVAVGASGVLTNSGTIYGNININPGGNYIGVGGTIHGTLSFNGKNTTYDGPGIETIIGNYVQGPTGVLDIGVQGTVAGSPTGYSVVNVTGNATLGGTLELTYLNGFKPTAGETLDFLNVGGMTSGNFSAVTIGGFLTLDISDTFGGGVLTITNVARDYTNPTLAAQLSPNQLAVGGSLNSVANSATGDFNTVLNSIDNLGSAQQIGAAFDQLSPQRLELFRNIAFDNFAFTSQQLDDHLANLRDGMTGLDTTGFAISDSALGSDLSQIKGHLLAWQPAPTPGLLSDTTSAELGGVAMTNPDIPENQRWSTFINGNVVLADLDSNGDVSHSDYTTGGVTLGADYRLNQHWTVGALLGYSHTDADLDNAGSTATVDTYSPGIYAAYTDHGWYASGLFNYGYNSYTENRTINFPGISRTAVGAPQGNQYSSDLDGGYEFHLGNWTVGPSAGLDYVHLDINSFSEGNAGSAGLNVQEQNADSLRSLLGFDTRWHAKYMKTDFTYHLSAHWQHEFMANSVGITSSLETPGISPFTVQSPGVDRDSALLDTGLDVQVANSADVFIDYQAEAGQSNFFAQSIDGGVKIGF
jgi:outer membrane autotransporter protein